jgi:hypothetical protein
MGVIPLTKLTGRPDPVVKLVKKIVAKKVTTTKTKATKNKKSPPKTGK